MGERTRLEFICEQYGAKSEECRMSMEVREGQQQANVFIANAMSFTGVLLLLVMIGSVVFVAVSRNLRKSA